MSRNGGLAAAFAVVAFALFCSAASAAPVLTISSPGDGTVTPSRSVSFAGTTSDTSDPVELHIVGFALPIETTQSGGNWSAGPIDLPADGTYKAYVEQTEVIREEGVEGTEGAEGTEPKERFETAVSSTTTFAVNTRVPTVTIFAPTIHGEELELAGHAGDEPGDSAEVRLKIYEEGVPESEPPVFEATVEPSGGVWRSAAIELPPGGYHVRATQDAPAGQGSSTRAFAITVRSPEVTLASPQLPKGTVVTSSGTPTFEAEPVAGNAAVTLKLYAGTSAAGEPIEEVPMTRAGEIWSATPGKVLENGIYTAQAEVEATGGARGVSKPIIFSVDVPAPFTPVGPEATTPSVATVQPASARPPVASFTWVPSNPSVGQSVSLVSSSTDPSSAINTFAWDLAGSGQFSPSGPAVTTSFASAGAHVVRLRVSDGNGLSSTATETIVVAPATPKLMQPFPIVRIAGTDTSFGARVRLLTVQAPLGATISLSCVGGGCKTKAERRVAKASSKSSTTVGAVTLKFARFERALRAGARLQIRVTQEGEIGKYTSFTIRRNRLPVRSDACLAPASNKPIACPV